MLSNYPVKHFITITGIDERITGDINPCLRKLEAFKYFFRDFKVPDKSILFIRVTKLIDGLKTRMFSSVNIHGQINITPASGQMLLRGEEHPGPRPAGRAAQMTMTYLMGSQVLLPKWKTQTTGDLCGPSSCNKASVRNSKNLLFWTI